MIKLAYFGSSEFAAALLEKIIDSHLPLELTCVVTQPDKPVGRKQVMTPTSVKALALKHKIQVIENIASLPSIDLALVYAYGEIIKSDALGLPKYSFWNIHPSLLPLYRGPAPMAMPLILDDKKTGVTLMKMDEKMDHGDIIDQAEYIIQDSDLRSDLELKLTELGFEIFRKNVNELQSSQTIKTTPQNNDAATFTRLLQKDDGFIPFELLKTALENQQHAFTPKIVEDFMNKNNTELEPLDLQHTVFNLYRGLYSWPGIWTMVKINDQDKRLKITAMTLEKGNIRLVKVQLEGKNEVNFETFNQAYKIF